LVTVRRGLGLTLGRSQVRIKMPLPTEQQCLNFFVEYKVPENIFQHCIKVREVAVFLAEKLQEAGIEVDCDFVSKLALLHDLFKVVAISDPAPTKHHPRSFTQEELEMRQYLRDKYPGKYEGEVAYEIFKDAYPELAKSLLVVSNPKNSAPSWEESIVHYSDGRVFKADVVSVSERLAYIEEVYPRSDVKWKEFTTKLFEEEARIFSLLKVLPEELKEEMGKEPRSDVNLASHTGSIPRGNFND
jgi:5'-deoxynucleotidase YfbR-like HD superfamily hydrolase